MRTLPSSLDNRIDQYRHLQDVLQKHQFTLGGNWDYDHGYYDRCLDGDNKVWLRIPFQVTTGRLESDSVSSNTMVQLGTPFVINHLYNEGLDREADMNVVSSLVNQFQDPIDPDAPVEDYWLEQAKQVLRQVEAQFV